MHICAFCDKLVSIRTCLKTLLYPEGAVLYRTYSRPINVCRRHSRSTAAGLGNGSRGSSRSRSLYQGLRRIDRCLTRRRHNRRPDWQPAVWRHYDMPPPHRLDYSQTDHTWSHTPEIGVWKGTLRTSSRTLFLTIQTDRISVHFRRLKWKMNLIERVAKFIVFSNFSAVDFQASLCLFIYAYLFIIFVIYSLWMTILFLLKICYYVG